MSKGRWILHKPYEAPHQHQLPAFITGRTPPIDAFGIGSVYECACGIRFVVEGAGDYPGGWQWRGVDSDGDIIKLRVTTAQYR